MADKHQIFSSNKRTRQKAHRSWRRKNRLRIGALSPVSPKTKGINLPASQSYTLVYQTEGVKDFGVKLNIKL